MSGLVTKAPPGGSTRALRRAAWPLLDGALPSTTPRKGALSLTTPRKGQRRVTLPERSAPALCRPTPATPVSNLKPGAQAGHGQVPPGRSPPAFRHEAGQELRLHGLQRSYPRAGYGRTPLTRRATLVTRVYNSFISFLKNHHSVAVSASSVPGSSTRTPLSLAAGSSQCRQQRTPRQQQKQ